MGDKSNCQVDGELVNGLAESHRTGELCAESKLKIHHGLARMDFESSSTE